LLFTFAGRDFGDSEQIGSYVGLRIIVAGWIEKCWAKAITVAVSLFFIMHCSSSYLCFVFRLFILVTAISFCVCPIEQHLQSYKYALNL